MHHTLYRRLQKLYHQQVLHRSHLTFVSSCLWGNVIPKGLRIKTIPLVPMIHSLQCTLQRKWTITLNKTSRALLKHLKEIANFEARLRNDAGFLENREEIRHIAQRKATAYKEKKSNKMSKLTNNAQRGTRQHH